jgi:uncharacterized damage-inducible protein DinB
MSDASTAKLLETIGSGLARDYGLFAERLHALVEEVSEEEFWTRPYPYGNSIGHLVLHVTGNLNYYIGAQIAGTGYVRDRPLEFTDTSRRPKAEVLRALDEAVAMVMATVRAQSAEDWSKPYSAVGANAADRFGNVLRSAEHFFHHLGQIVYLTREHARLRESRTQP